MRGGDRADTGQIIQAASEMKQRYDSGPSRGADVELSVAELVRLVAGLGRASRACFETSTKNFDILERLVLLLSDMGPMLLQGILGDVDVSRSFLERVEGAWAESGPVGNGTEIDYRWLRDLLGEQ